MTVTPELLTSSGPRSQISTINQQWSLSFNRAFSITIVQANIIDLRTSPRGASFSSIFLLRLNKQNPRGSRTNDGLEEDFNVLNGFARNNQSYREAVPQQSSLPSRSVWPSRFETSRWTVLLPRLLAVSTVAAKEIKAIFFYRFPLD